MLCWIYSISTGYLWNPEGEVVGKGYSGAAGYINQVKFCRLKGKGPLPPGSWTMNKAPWSTKGPHVLSLTPMEGTETYGRSALMIHGDNKRQNQTASNGCIILDRETRLKLATSPVAVLRTISGTIDTPF